MIVKCGQKSKVTPEIETLEMMGGNRVDLLINIIISFHC